MNRELKLLVEWSSPWQEFRTAIRPALSKSPVPLAGEARTELFPYRGMLAGWAAELVLLLAAVILPARIASLTPKPLPTFPKYDVIYFSGDELPQTEDTGGARAGRSGRSGGHEAHHRTQVIRVSRGETLREKLVDAPKLNLPSSDTAVANLLAYKPLPGPAPAEGLKPSLRAPAMATTVVPPAPEVQGEKRRAAPAINAAVVPPSPSSQQRDLNAVRIPGSQPVAVVPPPVSAPEQITNFHSQLTLPAPSVVAPPPTLVTRDVRALGPGFGPGTLQQIVPPTVQANGVFSERGTPHGMGSANVVPPPVQLNGAATGRAAVASLGNPGVVAPPVQVSGGSLRGQGTALLGGGTAVVPPPPTVSSGGSASGLGRGNRGKGLGGPMDVGSVAAPPGNTGGSVAGNGIVLSSQPGSKVGMPGGAGSGSLALSPNGGDQPGIGSGTGGTGIGLGPGPGSGMSREGPGATNTGSGPGADTIARSGISPYPGTGGAGTGTVGKPPIPGVSVHGGSNIITLPSFGADSGGSTSVPGRSTQTKGHEGPDITIVGSSRSGGAFNFYGTLKGDKVYTIYIGTTLGTAVLEYSDPASAAHPYGEDLVAPHAIRADLPANLRPSRLVISCILDRSGLLRNPRVLEPGGHELTTKVLAALSSWKFRPVFRGSEAIEVTAILGFGIDTR